MKKKPMLFLWIGIITIFIIGIILAIKYFVLDYEKYEDKNRIEIYDTNYIDVIQIDEEYKIDDAFLKLSISLNEFNNDHQTNYKLTDFNLSFEKNIFEKTNLGFIGKTKGQSKVYLDKKEETNKTIRMVVGNFYVTDRNFTGFTKITTPEELHNNIQDNPKGKFILGNDLDYNHQEFKPIVNFSGIIINPNHYKIKNCIFQSKDQQYYIFGTGEKAFIEGIHFENCQIQIKDSNINSIVVHHSNHGRDTLKNIHFTNMSIDASDFNDKALSLSIFDYGSERYQYVLNCSFELEDTINFQEEVQYFKINVFSELNNIKNCYAVINIQTNTHSEASLFNKVNAISSYCIVLGNMNKAYTSFNHGEYIYAYGVEPDLWESENPELLDLDKFQSGNTILGLEDFTFEVGKYPYLS